MHAKNYVITFLLHEQMCLNCTIPLQGTSRLRLVALNDPWSGDMRGIDHINYKCQQEAMDAKVDGVFRAFLSTRGVNIKSLGRNPNDIIVNLYNNTLFQSWDDVFRVNQKFLRRNNELWNSLKNNATSVLYSFNGKNVIMDEHW